MGCVGPAQNETILVSGPVLLLLQSRLGNVYDNSINFAAVVVKWFFSVVNIQHYRTTTVV